MDKNQMITVASGSSFRKILIPADDASAVQPLNLILESGSTAEVIVLVLPGTSCNLSLQVDLVGRGASCQLSGIYLCPEDERVGINVLLNHKVPDCTSTQLFKGIVSGTARSDFYGKIVVAPDAQKTEAYQANHTLLLSDDAKVNTKPQLEIYADDVRCSHGATIGKLNEEEQFYMRSRGISLEDAKVLQMISFLASVFEGIPEGEERDELIHTVEDAVRNRF